MKDRARVYVTGIDESCRDSILARAIELRNAGTLRAFLSKMAPAERLKIRPAIVTYEKSKMGKGNAKGQAKGAMGNLVEIICYGIKPNQDTSADFTSCKLELKVTGIREKDNEAKERVSMSMIPEELVFGSGSYSADMGVEEAYSNYGPIKSASSILFIVYKYRRNTYYLDAEIKQAFIWQPTGQQKAMMLDDFTTIRRMCDTGYAHCLSEKWGEFMGAATKSAGSKKGWRKPTKERQKTVLHEYLKANLRQPGRFSILWDKLKRAKLASGKIKKRCYSLKRKAVTEIISDQENKPGTAKRHSWRIRTGPN